MNKVLTLRILVLLFLFLCTIFSAISIGSYSILRAKESYYGLSATGYYGNFLGYITMTGQPNQDGVTICGAKEDDGTLYRGFVTNALFGFIAFIFFINAFAFVLHKPILSFALTIIGTGGVNVELGYGGGFALEILAFFFGIFSIVGLFLISRWTEKV
ncbi:hypothetical protein M0811_00827 [Anaeramoeba ignava]|uniref:Uncharacterized protein n=1 Tax=Anaeramoeba ignava TaxID=1746090 RepID=A0A9Q0LMN4_ANAIG|nr:hypothetical protein M0811_00827 [Anaeramoeba ignava]